MRRNLVGGLGVSIAVFLAGLALESSTLVQANAATTPATAASQNTAHAQVIAALRAAHRLLANADHDYYGHRARAAEEVHKALKDLGFRHHSTTATTGSVPKKTSQPAVHEAQAASDVQLRQAQGILQGVATQLNATRHPKATANIQAAIREINTALSLK